MQSAVVVVRSNNPGTYLIIVVYGLMYTGTVMSRAGLHHRLWYLIHLNAS